MLFLININLNKFNQLSSILIFILMAFFSHNSKAHDLGVVKATLSSITVTDSTENKQFYQLIADTSESTSYKITPPILPKSCQMNKPYNGLFTESKLIFKFSCERKLGVKDEITLLWLRDAVLLTATFVDEKIELKPENNRS